MPCISSILPIYNMESYLPRVLQSPAPADPAGF